MTPSLLAEWMGLLRDTGPRMSDDQKEACARLATVLLCGEQSAVQVFAAEVRRGRAPAEAVDQLRAIERDEQLHEQALHYFCNYLPRPDDVHALKRRAQRFFASLGRTEDIARHFAQIAVLDSAVCKVMWHIENSAVESTSPLRYLAAQIKNDEARHVGVSRRYAASLGLPVQPSEEYDATVDGLITMLDPLGDAFEKVGVDSDRLFTHLRRGRLS